MACSRVHRNRLIQKRAQVELDSELLLASNAAMQLCISEKQKSEEV